MNRIFHQIAAELDVNPEQVKATVSLMDDGATVPFIARYRKEITGSLTDTQLRMLEDRLGYLRTLEERKETILNTIREQGKLTPELERQIREALTKTTVEDLYLPYKPKRRTKGQIAIEVGLEPLADALLSNPALDPEITANAYLAPEQQINDSKAALDGARYILMERFSEAAPLLGKIRDFLWKSAFLTSKVIKEKEKNKEATNFRDYFDYREKLADIPSHRLLAVLRGRKEGILHLALGLKEDESPDVHPCQAMVAEYWNITQQNRPADAWLQEVVRWTWRVKLLPVMETDLISEARQAAEKQAITVFANNLKDLLLLAPAGPRITMGLDPGLRTGVKVAIIDATGQLLDHTTIFPHAPQNRTSEAMGQLVKLILKHNIELIAIGNGTASRETDNFVSNLIQQFPKLEIKKITVSEAGASVYSASALAANELPDLDVVFRGAVSIARRLQDPLAELVKIEPKSIGVGQYQHDVSQTQLAKALDATVEDCVNSVGVDVNTASSALLQRVAGLNKTLANNVVSYRDKNGAFKCRKQLLEVERMGARSYEQSAGFLRVAGGDNILDTSAVHPEAYPVVARIAEGCERPVNALISDTAFLETLEPSRFIDDTFGLATVTDIINELKKPGRDPRPEFKTATFKEGVNHIDDLKTDMVLEGVISNVTGFGAFVDIGVHQDGLVHISALCDRFVKDPRDVVKAGDVVKVKVIEVDVPRRRISLSMRLNEKAPQTDKKPERKPKPKDQVRHPPSPDKHRPKKQPHKKPAEKQGSFADLFANAKKLRK